MQSITGIPTEPEVTVIGLRSTAASPADEAQEVLLVQLRYEEHLARHTLQELFERGQLESLCA